MASLHGPIFFIMFIFLMIKEAEQTEYKKTCLQNTKRSTITEHNNKCVWKVKLVISFAYTGKTQSSFWLLRN